MDMLRKAKNTELSPKPEGTTSGLSRPLRTPSEWFDEMDRWFDDLRRNFLGTWDRMPLALRGDEQALRIREPLVDFVDEGPAFVVKAELPGVSKEDVDVEVTPEGIRIRAETSRQREETEKDYYFRERSYSSLQRSLAFPTQVLADQAEATLKDGLLEVRVPKTAPTPEKKAVKVRVA
jgi:HSP20 family protein